MKFPGQKTTPAHDLPATTNAESSVFKFPATASPTGASLLPPAGATRFFIRADGQYLVVTDIVQMEGWRIGNEIVMETFTRKMRNGVLGFKPNGEGEIFLGEDFFHN